MDYENTQSSPPILRLAVAGILALAAIPSAIAGAWVGLAVVLVVAALVAVALATFGRLTVTVSAEGLKAAFGWGWPRRTLPWTDATAVRAVRNRWWYGFGIRWFPGGTLWNVWGLDAVEFDLGSGRKLRIGTDQPEQLLEAASAYVPPG